MKAPNHLTSMAMLARVRRARRGSTWSAAILAALLVGGQAPPALAVDSDGDGLDDAWELSYLGGLDAAPGDDKDGDGLDNLAEFKLATDPNNADTDGDGLSDGAEVKPAGKVPPSNPKLVDTDTDGISDGDEVLQYGSNPTLIDSDSDGLSDGAEIKKYKTSPILADTDGGFSNDGAEVLTDGTDPAKPDDDLADTDGDGLSDWFELHKAGTDRFVADSDSDGLSDGDEVKTTLTSPLDPDADKDGLSDGEEVKAVKTDPLAKDTDKDGLDDGYEYYTTKTDPTQGDTDWDTLSDGDEVNVHKSNPLLLDSDGGGVWDPVEVFDKTNPADPADDAGKDPDQDGLSLNYEAKVTLTNGNDADSDGDGLDDGQEVFPADDRLVTPPLDADADDDGILDGNEGAISLNGGLGTIINGKTSPLRFDTDGDGLSDGVEIGLGKPQASAKDLDATGPAFVADTDPTTKTDPFEPDTDKDGLDDRAEDSNGDGAWTKAIHETDPNDPDSDDDGMDDAWEVAYSTAAGTGKPLDPLDPSDAKLDPDADGLSNLQEYEHLWPDAQGKLVRQSTHPRDADSDDDGLLDGVETKATYGGLPANVPGSNPNAKDTDSDGIDDGIEDANGNGKVDFDAKGKPKETSPKQSDSDGDGLSDGSEDSNHDGVWAKLAGETSPLLADSDGDTLPDGVEVKTYGTDPNAVDSDDDGLSDAIEVGKGGDLDPATKTNPIVADTDGDGLLDGVEDANHDGEVTVGALGKSETSPLLADSDADGLPDGVEDANHNGVVDPGETSPILADSDGDGLYDGAEDANHNGKVDPGETSPILADTDGGGSSDGQEKKDGTNGVVADDDLEGDFDQDGLKTGVEKAIGTNWKVADSDNDGIGDFDETDGGKAIDTDKDGTIDALDLDSDGDGAPDALEAGDALPATTPIDSDNDGTPDYRDLDSDGDALSDADEAKRGTSRVTSDTDGDGLGDGVEVGLSLDPLDVDSDDDGLIDGKENLADLDGDGLIGALDVDSDDDGLFDGTEAGVAVPLPDAVTSPSAGVTIALLGTDPGRRAFIADADPSTTTDPQTSDSDGDGLRDGAEDVDHDGKQGSGESDPNDKASATATKDADDDGLPDAEEVAIGTDPFDADSDDDGVVDVAEHNPSHDLDGDGLVNANDPDSDDDGLPDGLERGQTTVTVATDLLRFAFRPDADPTTTTSPLRADSDGDGILDGIEDANRDGSLLLVGGGGGPAPGESDPNDPNSKAEVVDADADGIPDVAELAIGTDPLDADSDDDGVPDGAEANAAFDADGDGLPGALDADSDNDGLLDGTELGVVKPVVGTDLSRGRFVADADPTTTTRVLAADSDRDGARDGAEDSNHDGAVSGGEGDPSDGKAILGGVDSDNDGLLDVEELAAGCDPKDADSDDDGLADGAEPNVGLDEDGDGKVGCRDADADDDGLFDGTEAGLVAADASVDTELAHGRFRADADPSTQTAVLARDTDRGGVADGFEDVSANGRLDQGESDPRDASDEALASDDLDGDGLGNSDELNLGTDPLRADSDGDGIPDGVEVKGGKSTSSAADTDGDGQIDALDTDSDGDGLSDALEAGPDATQPVDTDGDGVADFRDLDSDGDKLSDADEVTLHKTDPRKVDTDGGGIDDGTEVRVDGTDPLDPDDDLRGLESGARIAGSTLAGCSADVGPMTGAAGRRSLAATLVVALAALLALLFARGFEGLAPPGRRRPFRWWLGCLLPALALAAPRPATAAEARLPVVASSPRSVDGQDILGVELGRAGPMWLTAVSAQAEYLARPLVVERDGKELRALVYERLALDLRAGMRVWRDLTVGIEMPLALRQRGQGVERRGPDSGPIAASALGDLALAARWLWRDDRIAPVGLAASLRLSLPTGATDAYMGHGSPTATLRLAASKRLETLHVAANVGARLQAVESVPTVDDASAWRVAVAASWQATGGERDGVAFDAALDWQTALTRPFAGGSNQRLEAALAARIHVGRGLQLLLGSGFGLTPGFGVPAARPFIGLRFLPDVPESQRTPEDPLGVRAYGT